MPAHLIMPAYITIPMAKATVANSQRAKRKIKWVTFIYSVKDIQNIMKHCRNNNK